MCTEKNIICNKTIKICKMKEILSVKKKAGMTNL